MLEHPSRTVQRQIKLGADLGHMGGQAYTIHGKRQAVLRAPAEVDLIDHIIERHL